MLAKDGLLPIDSRPSKVPTKLPMPMARLEMSMLFLVPTSNLLIYFLMKFYRWIVESKKKKKTEVKRKKKL